MITVHQMSTRVPAQADPLDGPLNYTLSAKDLTLRRLVFLWGYQVIHKSFEQAARLDHAAGPAEEAELARVLRWSRGRFVPLNDSLGDPEFARTRGEVESRTGS
ncbi:MAG: hypothetical protein JJE39_09265 [Vicinamibacteria bacterium]|nr:hypothetical protein [Vicinamibacteria bacterium]